MEQPFIAIWRGSANASSWLWRSSNHGFRRVVVQGNAVLLEEDAFGSGESVNKNVSKPIVCGMRHWYQIFFTHIDRAGTMTENGNTQRESTCREILRHSGELQDLANAES